MAVPAHTSRSGMAFVTLATRERRPIFQISRLAELFIDTLLQFRTRGHYKLHAFLVMPDRVHLLISPLSHPLDQTIALIQKAFAASLDTTHILWEPGFTAHPIRTLRNLETLRTYLHQTPVRDHLAATPELYPYSSAHRQVQKNVPLPATTFVSESAS
jgi:putative transposase